MRLTNVSLLFALCAGVHAHVFKFSAGPAADPLARSSGVLELPISLEEPNFTGSTQVVLKGNVSLKEGSGYANKAFKVPMPADALFRIGSNSKLFVTVALYQLQERGVLNVSDPVSKHLNATDFKAMGLANVTEWCPRVNSSGPCSSPTIEQLLSMGSGIVDVTNCDYPKDSEYLQYCWTTFTPPPIRVITDTWLRNGNRLVDGLYGGDLAKLVGGFILNPLTEQPGTKYHYTNSNFVLASYLVEKYMNMGLGEYLDKYVTGPLKLEHTLLDNLGPQYSIEKYQNLPEEYVEIYTGQASEGGTYVDSGRAPVELAPGALSGAGGMFSTTEDMTVWYRTLFSDAPVVLTPASVLEIMRPRMKAAEGTYIAQGVFVQGYNNVTKWPAVLLYEGGTLNMQTAILYAPRPVDLCVTAFSSTKRANVTSAEAYRSLVNSRVGSYYKLLETIIQGIDDGGASALAHKLFMEYYPKA